MSNVESNNDHTKDAGRFNYLKNLKAYRDHGESFEDPSFGDSGYNSRHFTLNSTEAGSLIRQSTSTILKTIDEEPPRGSIVTATPASNASRVEKKVTILTPTTQSIQKMSSLQLTTPEGGMASAMDLSPFPGPDDFIEPKTPPELLLSIQEPRTSNSTPRKSKLYGRKRSFRDQIETDTENENYEQKRFRHEMVPKDDNHEKLARRMPFSPVVPKNNRRTLRQRSVSDNNLGHTLRSSTPKTFLMRPNLVEAGSRGAIPKQPILEKEENAEPKPIAMKKTPKKTPKKTLRRFQSFSPSKLAKKGKDPIFKKFSQDLNQPSTSRGLCDSFQLKGDKGLTNIPEEETQSVGLLRQNALDFTDIQTRDLPASEQCSLNITEADLSFIHGTGKSISPIKHHPNLENLFDAPIFPVDEIPSINFTSLNASQSLPSMELPSFERQLSSGTLNTSPSKKGLLYRDLPRTPSKSSSFLRSKSKTPSKKNLLERRSHYYDGMESLDFINRLHNEGVFHVVENIFQYLNGEDIINASKVSKKWMSAILNSKILNQRRIEYITQIKMKNAENLSVKDRSAAHTDLNIPNRKPFTTHNYDTRGMERIRQQSQYSPPASPGKIKFRENQKVVRRLSPRSMTTCPRCAKPSPIITQKKRDCIIKIGRSTRSSAKKPADLRKISSDPSPILARYRHTFDQSTMFNMDSSSSSSGSNNSTSDRKIRRTLFPATRSNTLPYDISKRNSLNSPSNSSGSFSRRASDGSGHSFQTPSSHDGTHGDDSFEEYGMCTGKQCGFRFCLRCKCEYQTNHVCHVSIEINSPIRDEDLISSRNTSNRFGSRQSKRTLKRL